MKLTGEPSNKQIDDYDNNESPQKRNTVLIIMIALVVIGLLSFFLMKTTNPMPSDYVGTTEEPGIVSTKVF